MSSIIQDLQSEATDTTNSVSDLLRKAKIVAVKLDLKEFEEWVERELNGYDVTSNDDLPDYRIISGEPKAWNPYHGWQPILFGDNKAGELMSRRGITSPVGELDDLVKTTSGTFAITYSNAAKKSIMRSIGHETDVSFMISRSSIVGVLNAVRNRILDSALKLEKAGVLGEGISFSEKDKQKAQMAGVTYSIGHIENFAGAIGNVSDNATISVHQLNAESKEELKKLIAQIEKYTPGLGLSAEQKKKVSHMNLVVIEEVSKEEPQQSKILSALHSLKNIFEGVAGNVIAQGIIVELAKYLR